MSILQTRNCCRILFTSPLLALAVGATSFAGATAPQYSVQFINPSNGAAAMNEGGDVVGTSSSPLRGWVSRGGALGTLLPLPAGMVSSWVNDINDNGVIVGAAGPFYSPEFGGKAVAWVPDGAGGYTIQQLGTLPGHTASNAAAVNNLGDIVGYSMSGGFRYPVLFTAPGGVQDLSFTGIFDPADINEERVLIDHSFTCKKLDLDTMVVQDLGTAGAGYVASAGATINESGQVAGLVILTSTTCDRQAARFTDEVGWEIFSTCGPHNGAQDMNDLGDLVVSINLGSYVRFEALGTFPIEDLIVNDVGHWYPVTLSSLAINNSRQVAVTATNPTLNKTGVLLLTPIAIPGDLDLDGDVDGADLGALLAAWGPCAECAADLNGDGDVDGADLGALLANWS